MTKRFGDLRAKMSHEARESSARKTEAMLADLELPDPGRQQDAARERTDSAHPPLVRGGGTAFHEGKPTSG